MFSKRKPGDIAPADGGGVPSLISSDMTIRGSVAAEGEMQIDGTVEGALTAAILVIGENGDVTGELVGERITVRGRVKGPIRGVHVKLAAKAHVGGDIIHQTLEVENGAVFEGSIRRSNDPIAEQVKQLTGPPLCDETQSTDMQSSEKSGKRTKKTTASRGRAEADAAGEKHANTTAAD